MNEQGEMSDDDQGCPYTEDYFIRGKEKGLSLYENYRWLGNESVFMAQAICRHLKIRATHTICDFGCARGYTVKALRKLGYSAFGVDCSPWAVENCDPEMKGFVRLGEMASPCDWVFAKDVLEHVVDLKATIDGLMASAGVGVFVVVPLGGGVGGYIIPDYERDCTHIHRMMLFEWAAMFMRPGWEVTSSYRMKGVKDNWWKTGWELGNGFFVCRRL